MSAIPPQNTVFDRIEKFSHGSRDSFLGISFAYMGEILQKSAEKEIFRPEKISIPHYNILNSLSVESPRTASSIAPVVLGTPANFSAILSRMEKDHLITRKHSQHDKREVLVSWTTKGQEIFERIYPQFQNFFKTRFSNISENDKKEMQNMIQIFQKNFNSE